MNLLVKKNMNIITSTNEILHVRAATPALLPNTVFLLHKVILSSFVASETLLHFSPMLLLASSPAHVKLVLDRTATAVFE